jgi:hypothetical protein
LLVVAIETLYAGMGVIHVEHGIFSVPLQLQTYTKSKCLADIFQKKFISEIPVSSSSNRSFTFMSQTA